MFFVVDFLLLFFTDSSSTVLQSENIILVMSVLWNLLRLPLFPDLWAFL